MNISPILQSIGRDYCFYIDNDLEMKGGLAHHSFYNLNNAP
jgi:hypothetical protein